MALFYATTNKSKVKSLQRKLEIYSIEVEQVPFEMPEPRSDDVRVIAKEKVVYAFSKLQKPVVALDAGFFIPSLNGFPKAYVNFALQTIGLEGILKLAENKDRECEFSECLAYLDEKLTEPIFFEDKVEGTLAKKEKGTMQEHLWSKLALIFKPKNSEKTLAEMTYQEYLKWQAECRKKSYAAQFSKWYATQKK